MKSFNEWLKSKSKSKSKRPKIKLGGRMDRIADKRERGAETRRPGEDIDTVLQPDEQDRDFHVDPFFRDEK